MVNFDANERELCELTRIFMGSVLFKRVGSCGIYIAVVHDFYLR